MPTTTVDANISSLPSVTSVDDASLFVVEQQGTASKATGAQWKAYAVAAVQPYAIQALTYVDVIELTPRAAEALEGVIIFEEGDNGRQTDKQSTGGNEC